jgi:hypothetical protein
MHGPVLACFRTYWPDLKITVAGFDHGDVNGNDIRSLMGPEINQTPAPITFGPCPMCKTPLRLALIEPDKPDHEKRTYQCDSCGHSKTKTVKYR